VDDRDRWAGLLAETAAERESQPRRIGELCVEMLGVTGAGISMLTKSGNHGVICATDDVSSRIEDLQLTLGEGPCIDAVGSGTPVLVSDLQDTDDVLTQRWPAFTEGAGEAGVRAVFAFPLRIGAISVGAMDLYRDEPGELAAFEFPHALMAADAAAHALLHLDSLPDGMADTTADFRTAFHPQVNQATGMVQVQLGVPTDEAFVLLRARAFATGRTLVELAADVVNRRIRFSTEDQ
jgi:hypothetical protein